MKKNLLIALAFLLFLSACDSKVAPPPKARYTYQINDEGEVEFKNGSTDAIKYDYSIDGTHNLTPNFVYKFSKNGQYTVTLTVLNSDGAKNTYSDDINIINVSGSAMFFKGPIGNQLDIEVYVDKIYNGKIKGQYYYDDAPDCGNQYSATFNKLAPGSHTYRYIFGSTVVDGSFTVISGVCSKFRIVK